MDFNSSTIQLSQASDGSWRAFLADYDKSVTAEAVDDMDFGLDCVLTLAGGATTDINRFTETSSNTYSPSDDCSDPGDQTKDNEPEVVQSAISLAQAGAAGQPGPATIGNNGMENVLWPFIYTIDFSADNMLTYGDDTIYVS